MPHKGVWPRLAGQVFIAPGAWVIGDVAVGQGSSIWFNSVIRGDEGIVRIGRYTNLQDGSVVHLDKAFPAVVGDYVTVGHNAILHGCTIGDNCLIGMGAIIMNGAKIGDNCIVGAGSLIGEGKTIPAGSLVVGAPGRVIRKLSAEAIATVRESARHYYEKACEYAANI
jgi:Carbonic anhydrases/acetyltransferases, isoleucine patch superfamily